MLSGDEAVNLGLADAEIARACVMRPIVEVAQQLGLREEDLELYGRYKAKVHLDVLSHLADRQSGRYIAVTSVSPTPLGEGKTMTTIGLAQALDGLGHSALPCIRQPSMGPTFGIKGGAAGGGYAQVVPMEDVNLHLTGDIHAVGAAHNLLAAALDAHLFHGNALDVDPRAIMLNRVVDVDDRALRRIVVGLDEPDGGGVVRQSGYDLTAASEVMAVLALATSLDDLRARLGRMVVALARDGSPVTAERLKVAGAMAVLLKDALMPNLLQTLAGSPAFVHTGAFANVGHGNSSVIADRLALKLTDYVVTECGFGADLGFEKFMHIKTPVMGLAPDCVVLVATVRALKMHGGVGRVAVGRPLPPELTEENLPAVNRGSANLVKQIANARRYGAPVVVAVNRFSTDSPREVDAVRRSAVEAGAVEACPLTVWADGGAGGVELARSVIAACETRGGGRDSLPPRLLYPDSAPIKAKIEAIAREIYGASGVDYLTEAERSIARVTRLGSGHLPICMAKTPLSLSHDPRLLGAPSGYRLPVHGVRLWAGAGFLNVLCGDIRTMPGLPTHPGFEKIDLVDGQVVGLS